VLQFRGAAWSIPPLLHINAIELQQNSFPLLVVGDKMSSNRVIDFATVLQL
jgi:hypothetical protein